MNRQNESILQQLLSRVRPSAPHHGYFSQAINRAFAISDRFDSEVLRINADGRYSDSGKRQAVAELVKSDFAPELASGPAKVGRHAAQRNASRRVGMSRPTFDKSDLVAALERREVRDYLRGQPDGRRMQVAMELVTDKKMAEAILSGPGAAMTGLTPDQLATVSNYYLRHHHADQSVDIDAERDDIQAVLAAAEIARRKLFAASGMSEHGWAEYWQTLELAADAS